MLFPADSIKFYQHFQDFDIIPNTAKFSLKGGNVKGNQTMDGSLKCIWNLLF